MFCPVKRAAHHHNNSGKPLNGFATIPMRKCPFPCVIFLQHGVKKANSGRWRGANAAKGA
jgi:hypothetical protein